MNPRTMNIETVAHALRLLAIGAAILGNPGAASAEGCDRIKPSQPAQFITFERTGVDKPLYAGESKDRAWLRLHNNTTCPIRFLGGHIHVLPDGTVSMDPADGEETRLAYDVYDSLTSGEPQKRSGGDSNSVAVLRPGFSVVFSVPLSHFRAGLGVAVPFGYPWEDSSIRQFRLRHYVYLLPEELPKAVRGRLKRTAVQY